MPAVVAAASAVVGVVAEAWGLRSGLDSVEMSVLMSEVMLVVVLARLMDGRPCSMKSEASVVAEDWMCTSVVGELLAELILCSGCDVLVLDPPQEGWPPVGLFDGMFRGQRGEFQQSDRSEEVFVFCEGFPWPACMLAICIGIHEVGMFETLSNRRL